MKEKSFENATEAEARQCADDWSKSQPGIRVLSTQVVSEITPVTEAYQPIQSRWTAVVKYEDGSN